jgi:quercetin dioxygenase-like cupin family protein
MKTNKKTRNPQKTEMFSEPLLATLLTSLKPVALARTKSAALKKAILADITATQPVFVRNAIHADPAAWLRVTAGIDYQVLFDNGKTSAQMIRFAPGAISLGHRHQFDEAAMVIEGWCTIGNLRLNTGDYYMVPAGASHDDIVSPEGCILFLHGPSYRRADKKTQQSSKNR